MNKKKSVGNVYIYSWKLFFGYYFRVTTVCNLWSENGRFFPQKKMWQDSGDSVAFSLSQSHLTNCFHKNYLLDGFLFVFILINGPSTLKLKSRNSQFHSCAQQKKSLLVDFLCRYYNHKIKIKVERMLRTIKNDRANGLSPPTQPNKFLPKLCVWNFSGAGGADRTNGGTNPKPLSSSNVDID